MCVVQTFGKIVGVYHSLTSLKGRLNQQSQSTHIVSGIKLGSENYNKLLCLIKMKQNERFEK